MLSDGKNTSGRVYLYDEPTTGKKVTKRYGNETNEKHEKKLSMEDRSVIS